MIIKLQIIIYDGFSVKKNLVLIKTKQSKKFLFLGLLMWSKLSINMKTLKIMKAMLGTHTFSEDRDQFV